MGVDNRGGRGLCCFCLFFVVFGDANVLSTILEAKSPPPLLLPSPIGMVDVTSSSFMSTARMERAAVNGSVCCRMGNDIPIFCVHILLCGVEKITNNDLLR